MTVRLHTLGRLSLDVDGREVSGDAVQPRRLALMALLAAAGEAGLMREKILGLLWPDHPSPRTILNESLFVLRGAIGKSAIQSVGDSLRLDAAAVWTDVGAFAERVAAGTLGEAVELYRGPFLDGFYVRGAAEFEQWVGREQDRLRRDLARVLETLAEQAEEGEDAVGAAEWWRRLAEHDPFSTRVAMRYVEALVRAQEPVLAVRYATEFTERMRSELGIEPDASLVDHAKSLIAAPAERVPAAGGDAGASAGSTPRTPAPSGGPVQPTSDLEGLAPDLEVVGLIGEGSVARVYLAKERVLDRLVAIKVLSAALARDGTARARFEREARAAANIQHPNVAPVYRTGTLASGVPYLVMPYFHGGSLESRLKAAGPLPVAEARRYIGQIAAGLAAAHRLGIVHRDVRPANILYDRDTHRVVLIDFGIAAVLDAGAGAANRLTRPGERLGIPAYASPEQIRGEPAITDRTDVYSLGVVAFEMLAGELPFGATTALQMMRAHSGEQPRSLLELREEAGPELVWLVRQCLSKRPEDRPLAADVAEEMSG